MKLTIFGIALILIGALNNILPEAQSQEAEEDRKFENTTFLIEKADEFYDSGQKEEAIKYYDMALVINKSDTYALNRIGDSLYNLERYNDSIKYYDKTLAINKSDDRNIPVHCPHYTHLTVPLFCSQYSH